MLGLALASCDKYVYDGPGNCDVTVRFKYEFNMKYVDAFAAEVHSVAVYVFDPATGAFITKATDAGQHLDENYYMTIPELTVGTYDLVAWCGLEDSEFTVSDPKNISELLCRMNTRTKAEEMVDFDLGTVYHGILKGVELVPLPPGGVQTVKIPLRRNTNSINVVLQTLQRSWEIEPADYEITIEDNVVELDHANEPTREEPVTYYPWDYRQVSVEYEEGTSALTAVLAEFTTNRLIKRSGYKPRLRIKDKGTGATVIDIPLIDCLLMVKGNYNRSMDDQEYLDRQHDYNLIFFLDNSQGPSGYWNTSVGIYINGWHVVWFSSEL